MDPKSILPRATVIALSSIPFARLHCDEHTRSIPKTNQGKQYLYVRTDRYSKLTRDILVSRTTSLHTSNIILDQGTVSFVIPANLLTNNKPQLESKCLTLVCGCFDNNHSTRTMTYHPQSNKDVEHSIQTIVTGL